MQPRPRSAGRLLFVLVLACAAGGCGWAAPAPPGPAAQAAGMERSVITDPKLNEAAEAWQAWVLHQSVGGKGERLFSRVELLPVTVTTLPYGVGAYQQQRRLPVIVTTGPGWTGLSVEQKEEQTARIYRELSDRLEKAGFAQECPPTLTLQSPQGMLLAWVNDLTPGRKRIHGDND